ncbi:uncharacterized protein LOC108111365 [Drosophila eugracilis]|uniref:uncharacterized protein LOC108111365 n=1 Tax=Drosophila eugracilis TaxID=29029 RepID=UPI0007E8B486|nr:uncharacterized protein LOC108111365 [Drosophila eugracilis]
MADTIRCICDSLNSMVGYLVTMRVCEIRHCLEFLGVAHTEVILGVILFVLLQFTKFTAVLLLAVLLAYGIFYMWETFFPEITQLGHRGMKMFRNVRTSANLPPFASDTEETPGEYVIRPKVKQYTSGIVPPPNTTMLLPMLPTNLRTTGLQTDRRRQEEENRRGSRGRGHTSHREPQETGTHRQDRPYWRPVSPEREQHHSAKKNPRGASGSGGAGESKRLQNVMRIPTVTSGVVDTRRLSNVTSDQLKRLPNMTSGESRRIPKVTSGANESKKLYNMTSGEIIDSRRIPKLTTNTNGSRWLPKLTSGENRESRRVQKMTSNTNESRKLPNITSGEVKDNRKSSRPSDGGELRRTFNNHRGYDESKTRRPLEKSHPGPGRRSEEQSKQRKTSNGHSAVTTRRFPEDHYDRLKLENREYQARRLQGSGAPGFRQGLSNPTSEGALLTKHDNFIPNHRQGEGREFQRNTKSSHPGKDRSRPYRIPNPVF